MITTLHDPVVHVSDGVLEQRTQITFAPGTLDGGEVVQRVMPGDVAVPDASVLPLVPAALVLACRLSQDLRVEEPLPPAIHDGARRVAALLHAWYGWRPAELIAPLATETVRPPWAHRRRGRGVLFTRGVDSWGTLFDLLDGPARDRPTHLITVDNEIHLDPALRDDQIAQTQAVADRLGLPLITVATDVRAVIDPHTDWGTDTHGSVLAGIALLLRRALSEVVISPTHWTPLLRPWGSHPDLEPSWSIPGLRVVHHPGDEPRWQRTQRIMAKPVAAETLQVCWQGTSDRNCGRCEKCLRLMTSLELLGIMERSSGRFDVPFDPERIVPGLSVSPHPWCDTMDHLDHVGLRGDALRQRWERVTVSGRPKLWFQTRAVQPRIAVVADPAAGTVVEALDRHLAALGVRRDHLVADPAVVPHVALGIDDGRPTVVVLPGQPGGAPILRPLGDLVLADLAPVLPATGPGAAVPFDPDGQEPPPVEPEPPGWTPDDEPALDAIAALHG